MTGNDAAGANGTGDSGGEEEAWQDLVARFDVPGPDDGETPWPERENLGGPARVPPDAAAPAPADPEGKETAQPGASGGRPTGAGPAAGPASGPAVGPGTGSAAGPGVGPTAGPATGPQPVHIPGSLPAEPRSWTAPPDPAEEHFIPPPPPPLPKLDPVAKGAWLALFGGPAYLVIALVLGWTVSGFAAFLAVAAFVGGFVTLVMRMGDGPPRDSGGPDDGAVV